MILAVMIAAGCGSKTQSQQQIVPQRATNDLGADNLQWDKTQMTQFGLAGVTPVVNLEYIPAEAGRAALAGCLAPLADDFEVGFAICNGNDERHPVFAKNVEQYCSADPKWQSIGVKEQMTPPCSRFKLYGHVFVPSLGFSTRKN